MITADSHLHTAFSADAAVPPRDQVLRAVDAGLTHLTFTDHYDPDCPEGDYDFTFDIDDYFRILTDLKEEFRGRIDIGIGVELGAQPHLHDELERIASGYPFDFIINSTHLVGRTDPYDGEVYFRERTESEGLRAYFEEILKNLNAFDDWDICGHIDYAVRYMPSGVTDYKYEDYADILDEILKTVIAKGKGIEVNTAGLKAGLAFAHPHPSVLRRYRELGGELVTVGSDAHNPVQVGRYFDRAADALKEAGFQYYAWFRSRRPVFKTL